MKLVNVPFPEHLSHLLVLTAAVWSLTNLREIRKPATFAQPRNWTDQGIVHQSHSPTFYFIWTTAKDTFKPRHLQVLDSYLYHHPLARLKIIATDLSPSLFAHYQKAGYDIQVEQLTDQWLMDLAAGTSHTDACPGKPWLERLPEWRQGPYFYSHITDYIRFCLLYRFGGIYSDFDAYLLQRLDDKPWFEPGFIGKDSSGAGGKCDWCLTGGDKYVAPGLMKASAKSPVIRAALELAFGDPSTYNSNIFNAVGPKAITMAIKKYPDSIHILDQHVFYPFVYSDAHILMKNTNDPQALVQRLRRKSTSLHLYGHQTRMLNEEPKSIIQAVYDTFSITDPATYQLHVPINYLPTPFESTVIPDVHIRFPIDPQQFAETNFTVTIAAQHGSVRLIPDKTYHQQIKISGTSKNIHRINAKLSQMIYQMNNAQERDTITINLESELSPPQTHHIQVYNVAKLATLIVKTFGRMDKVFALVRTVRHYYPGLRILVADDGESIAKTAGKYRGFEYLPLPYDVGLSAGRNCLLEKVDTPYFMTLDDDFLLDEQSVIEGLIHALEVGNFDIAAGKNPVDESKFDIDFCGTMTVDATAMWLQPGFRGEPRAECHPVDFVPNLFAARTQVIREKLLWDENLKLGEHEDFFWRAKQLGIRVATCPAVSFIHDQVPHWLQRTKYEKLRSRVYDFWKVSLKKHGLSRLVSFGTVVMDLVEPPPLRCLYSTEIMSQSFSLEWYGCSDAVQFKVVHQLGTDSYTTVNAGEGESWRERRITIRLVQPNTDYTIVVFASNGFVNEKIGRKIIVRTLPDNFLDGELLKNGGFESGHFDWYSSFGVPHHIVRPGHSSNFAARMHITTRGYNSFHPTPSKLYQIVDMSKVTKPFHRLQIVGWSRVERFYGMTSNWRLGAIVEFKDRLQTYSYYEEFDHALLDWQVRSFTICLRDGSLVDRVTIYGELVAHRGSVFFDNFSVKVF